MPEVTEPPTIDSILLELLGIVAELVARVEALEVK